MDILNIQDLTSDFSVMDVVLVLVMLAEGLAPAIGGIDSAQRALADGAAWSKERFIISLAVRFATFYKVTGIGEDHPAMGASKVFPVPGFP